MPELASKPPPILEARIPALMRSELLRTSRLFLWHNLTALVAQSFNTQTGEWDGDYHLSISGAATSRYPTWEEVTILRYALVPRDRTMAMLLDVDADADVALGEFVVQLHEVEWSAPRPRSSPLPDLPDALRARIPKVIMLDKATRPPSEPPDVLV